MEQNDLIESIENPGNDSESSEERGSQASQMNVNPLPEDLLTPKKEKNAADIINMISYITLAFAGLFLLILYLLGLLK